MRTAPTPRGWIPNCYNLSMTLRYRGWRLGLGGLLLLPLLIVACNNNPQPTPTVFSSPTPIPNATRSGNLPILPSGPGGSGTTPRPGR